MWQNYHRDLQPDTIPLIIVTIKRLATWKKERMKENLQTNFPIEHALMLHDA